MPTLSLLQITDSMFPTGAFAHSLGLETYVQRGLVTDGAGLTDLLGSQLRHGLGSFDMVLCREAYAAAKSADLDTIQDLDELAGAAKPVTELRKASEETGRRLVRSVLGMEDNPTLAAYNKAIQSGTCSGHHAVALGMVGHVLAIPIADLLQGMVYAFVAGQASAAVRLIPLGQTQAQQTIRDLIPNMQAATEQALTLPLDTAHTFLPGLAIRAMQHEYLDGRLFVS